MTADPALLGRVRKLLALAESPNVHEAASAAALAQGLIDRHRLERWLNVQEEQQLDPIEDARDTPLDVARRQRTWKVVLATTLADANNCLAYTLDLGAEKAIVLVGSGRDRAAVLELWTWLVKRIEWLSATHGAGRNRKWHIAFRVGVVAAVAEQLSSVAAEVRGELSPGALMRVDPAERAQREALDRYVSENLRLGRGRGLRVDAAAWQAGHEAGAVLAVATQPDSKPAHQATIKVK